LYQSIIKNTQIMKKLIWLPVIGEMFIVSKIEKISHLDEFFPSRVSLITYIIYQTTMWFLLGAAFVMYV
jgi:hypothetical protein